MKIKTSITLSEDIMLALDALGDEFKNRSDAIEQAVLAFLDLRQRQKREAEDLKILNKKAKKLNAEAEDVLSYQVEL